MPVEPRLDFAILIDRLQRLVRLDTSVFDEVRRDPAATVPAFGVLVVSTFLAGIGGWLKIVVEDGDGSKALVQSAVVGSLICVGLWILWLFMATLVLNQVFRQEADWQEMLRTMGMAALPLSLSVAIFIPEVDFGVGLTSIVLLFGLTTIAIQAVTPANHAQVLVANLSGFALWAIVLALLVTTDSWLAPGIFLWAMT